MNVVMNDSIPGWNDVFSLNVLGEMAADVPSDGWIFEVNSYCGRASYVLGMNKDPDALLTCTEEFPDCPQQVPEGCYGNTSRHYNHFTFNITMEDVPNCEIITAKVPFFSKAAVFHKRINLLYFNNPWDPERTYPQVKSLEPLLDTGSIVAFNANTKIINTLSSCLVPELYDIKKEYNIIYAIRK